MMNRNPQVVIDYLINEMNNNVTIPNDPPIPQEMITYIAPQHIGKTVTIKSGDYPVDYTGSEYGKFVLNLDIR